MVGDSRSSAQRRQIGHPHALKADPHLRSPGVLPLQKTFTSTAGRERSQFDKPGLAFCFLPAGGNRRAAKAILQCLISAYSVRKGCNLNQEVSDAPSEQWI